MTIADFKPLNHIQGWTRRSDLRLARRSDSSPFHIEKGNSNQELLFARTCGLSGNTVLQAVNAWCWEDPAPGGCTVAVAAFTGDYESKRTDAFASTAWTTQEMAEQEALDRAVAMMRSEPEEFMVRIAMMEAVV